MFSEKKTLLLDMNSTFMFGEDNFGSSEDFSKYYHKIGGELSRTKINSFIRLIYNYMNNIYPEEKYRHEFPSIKSVIESNVTDKLSDDEISRIIRTFSFHEIGHIPVDFIRTLHKLKQRFQLALVIDIWSPKERWCRLFEELGIDKLFSASSFSSDHGMVKPSPKPFELVLDQLNIEKHKALVIGDSVRRDLGGASLAGIDCVLVGGAKDLGAVKCYENLIAFAYDAHKEKPLKMADFPTS